MHRIKRKSEYLWEHKIDLEQDAIIEAAIEENRKKTGRIIDKYTMLKIIIWEYGKGLGR